MSGEVSWDRDGKTWPLHQVSRFVRTTDVTWHVQIMGEGPVVLLLHGTGASTHSWRALMPLLAEHFKVVAMDLPGHAFTQAAPREFLSMNGMGLAIRALLRELGLAPAVVVGHSAGAAIAVRMVIDRHISPGLIVGINAALMPLQGIRGHLFSPLAKLFMRIPFLSHLVARRTIDRSMFEAMLAATGSKLDREGVELYWRLAQTPHHLEATVAMMAEWDLPRLQGNLRRLKTPLLLITGAHDRTIPPSDAERLRALLPDTRVVSLPGLGHLAHEERPDLVGTAIVDAAVQAGAVQKQD